ncbi:uncharacterized protein L203_105074 [Cryptococcus depauperatus CBS 7841]|uniref:Uncharacterized protein n=1 Tax=Cryptococcus depauperatus CBS 7841 TaxID=1295531 RepID=A0AAJ8JWX7_9TREE
MSLPSGRSNDPSQHFVSLGGPSSPSSIPVTVAPKAKDNKRYAQVRKAGKKHRDNKRRQEEEEASGLEQHMWTLIDRIYGDDIPDTMSECFRYRPEKRRARITHFKSCIRMLEGTEATVNSGTQRSEQEDGVSGPNPYGEDAIPPGQDASMDIGSSRPVSGGNDSYLKTWTEFLKDNDIAAEDGQNPGGSPFVLF